MTATKEKPILFSGEMVRAILDGRKTQTRRIVKPQPAKWIDRYEQSMSPRHWIPQGVFLSDPSGVLGKGALEIRGNDTPVKCPYEVGTRLWIKTGYETRYDAHFDQTFWQIPPRGLFTVTHGKATSKSGRAKRDGGHPGRFMPHWLSMELRLPVLEITDIRVQRLQEISHSDALAEGCKPDWDAFNDATIGCEGWEEPEEFEEECEQECDWINYGHELVPSREHAEWERDRVIYATRLAFHNLWDSINGSKYPWDANPWVWAISFKRLEDR